MKLHYDPELVFKLSNKRLFLDTDVIIDSQKYTNLLEFIFELKEQQVELLTIQSVFFEFMRGSQSVSDFNKNAIFFETLVDIYPIEKQQSRLDNLENLIVVMSNIQNNDSYADFLLIASLYIFKGKSYLLTANNKHYPTNILNRIDIITLDTGNEIKNYGVYRFSEEKYQKAAKNILRNK